MNLDDVLLSWNINLLKLGNQIWQILSLLQKNKKGIIYPKQKKETRSPSSNSSFTQRPKPTLRLLWLQPSWDAMCWPGFIMIMITMIRKMMTLVIYSIQSGTNPADQVWGLLLGMAMQMRPCWIYVGWCAYEAMSDACQLTNLMAPWKKPNHPENRLFWPEFHLTCSQISQIWMGERWGFFFTIWCCSQNCFPC